MHGGLLISSENSSDLIWNPYSFFIPGIILLLDATHDRLGTTLTYNFPVPSFKREEEEISRAPWMTARISTSSDSRDAIDNPIIFMNNFPKFLGSKFRDNASDAR